MAVIDHLDVDNKLIYLATDVREYHPTDDIYKEVRDLRRLDESLRGFIIPVVASGNVAKGGGKYTARLAIFQDDWRIVPEDVSHTLAVTGEQITDEGTSGAACFDFTPLSYSTKIVVEYAPPDTEIIEMGTSGLTEEESANLAAMGTNLAFIKAIESGRWKILNNQMIFYDANDDELITFDLKDKSGNATNINVYERIPT